MKRYIFILTGLVLLTVTSCNKEEIRPNSDNDNAKDQRSDYNEKSNSSNFLTADYKLDSLINITDPNRDEDDERKRKTK